MERSLLKIAIIKKEIKIFIIEISQVIKNNIELDKLYTKPIFMKQLL